MENKEQVKEKKSRRFNIFRSFLYLLLFVILFPLFVSLLLQIKVVQNFTVDQITSILGRRFNGDIIIGDVDFSFRYGLDLNEFLLIDDHRDTLIQADKFTLNLTSSLATLYENELNINSVSLENPRIRVTKRLGETKSDLALVLDKLLNVEVGYEETAGVELDVKSIRLNGLDLVINDLNTGQRTSVTLLDGHIVVNKMTAETLDVELLRLIEPVINITRDEAGHTNVSTERVAEAPAKKDGADPRIKLSALEVVEGQVFYNDNRRQKLNSSKFFDYNHFFIDDLYLEVNNFLLDGSEQVQADIKNLSLHTDDGYRLHTLKTPDFTFNDQGISFKNLLLETDQSIIKDHVNFQFEDLGAFKNFSDEVKMYAQLNQSKISVDELMYFVRDLERIDIFRYNRAKNIHINGQVAGTVNNFKSESLTLHVPGGLYLKGRIAANNIAVKGKEHLNIDVDSFHTTVNSMQRMIPKFKPNDQVKQLGDVFFKGNYTGTLDKFNATGRLRSRLGSARMNLDMDLKAGKELAAYSGDVSLKDFDIGTLLGNEDLGSLTFEGKITDGQGLTPETAHARVDAVVNKFFYKDYEYNDFKLDGLLDKNRFRGLFDISDEDIDLTFNGIVEVENGLPYFAFDASIKKLDLFQMNIVQKPFAVEGVFHINMEGRTIDDMVGEFFGNNMVIATNDTIYSLDTLNADVTLLGPERKALNLSSEIFDISIEGDYHLNSLVPTMRHFLKKEYPLFLEHWPDNKKDISRQIVDMDVRISDSKNLFELIGVNNFHLTDVDIQAAINTDEEYIELEGRLPFIKLGGSDFLNSHLALYHKDNQAQANIRINTSYIEGLDFNPIDISILVDDENLNFSITTDQVVDSIERINLMFTLSPVLNGYDVTFDNDRMTFLGKNWEFHPDNKVFLGDDYLDISHLILSDGNRKIELQHQENHKGISIAFDRFDFNIINSVLRLKKLDFSGVGSYNFYIANIFDKQTGVIADIDIPEFYVNKEPYGGLDLYVNRPRGQNVDLNFKLGNADYLVNMLAEYNPTSKEVAADVKATNFPLKFFEFIIKDGIKNTTGGINLKGVVNGPLKAMNIDAVGNIVDAATTIIYTGATYYIKDQEVKVTEKIIDATGAEITDINGNPGRITGGLHHNYFTDFGLDVTLAGADIVALNTTKKDNPLYYGVGRGNISARFSGPLERANLRINTIAGRGSEISIPIQSTQSDINDNFITFIEEGSIEDNAENLSRAVKIEGLDLEMDLELTPEAKVNLIFDESRGDIIEGRGRAGLKIYVTRSGEFDIYGDYEIESGNYLFTAFGLVAKPFTVRRGGLVRWTGDPVNATLNIEADYSLRAPLNIFLSEYLTTPQQIDEAANKTEVNLKMILTNKLFNPTVNFDLDFPNLTGELRSLAESKMRILKTNQNELNNQVLGLIVFNSFLPSSSLRDVGGADLSSAGISTLSEFVSSQLSILFTGLINEALTENGLVAGVDFDIGIRKNSFYGVSTVSNDLLPDEIEVNLKNRFRFLDERLSLDVGGNYVRAPIRNIQEYFIGDFVVEYFLTDDRKLKLRMYGKYDYDEAVADRKLKYGLGLGYRTEFGKLSEFKNRIAQSIGESQPENQ